MKYISLIVAFFFAVLFSACGAKEEKTEQNDANTEVVDETPDSLAYGGDNEFIDESDNDFNPVDSTANMVMPDENTEMTQVNEQEETKPAIIEESKTEVKEEPIKKEEPKVHEARFYVVVGSFKKYSNAQNLKNYFEKEGYMPMILPKVNEYNRVAIASYVEKANAKKAVTHLRNKYNDLTFWIYKW